MTDGHRQKVDETTQVDRTEVHSREVHGAQVHRSEVHGETQVHRTEVHGEEVHRAQVHGAAQVLRPEVDTQVASTQVDRPEVDQKKEVGCQEVDSTQIDGEASLNAGPSARSGEGATGPLSALVRADPHTRATLPQRRVRTLP